MGSDNTFGETNFNPKEYNQRLQVAEWLNTLGYDIEIDKDGLWMEEYIWQEHKTKDVIDIILNWNDKNSEALSESQSVSDNEGEKKLCRKHSKCTSKWKDVFYNCKGPYVMLKCYEA